MTNEHDMTAPIPSTRPALENRPTIKAYECAPIGLNGHRWPCPAAETAGAECADQGCGVGVGVEEAVEKVVVVPELSATTEYVRDVKAATEAIEALMPRIEEAMALVGKVTPEHWRTWETGDWIDGVPERFDELTGWNRLADLLHYVRALCSAGIGDVEFEMPVGFAPEWWVPLCIEQLQHRLDRATDSSTRLWYTNELASFGVEGAQERFEVEMAEAQAAYEAGVQA